MINITFTEDVISAARDTCPICASTQRRPLLTLSGGTLSGDGLHMDTCGDCGTGYFVESEPVIGYGDPDFERDYWINYVQNGAGISAMVEPLLAVDRPRSGSLLDIGCGFGFVPHFWKTCGFGEAIGMEVTKYGEVGAEKLSVDIIPKYYSEAEDLQGRTFDYVFSSEVIEHVEDPKAFVTEISAALASDGILVLTTPSATSLTETTSYPELLQVLSPGLHYFIASRQGLEDLLKACGFAHVLVRDSGNRLFAWASHTPLPNIREGFSDSPLYLDYLDKLAEVEDLHVASGALYRVMKDAFNLGYFERAESAYQKFATLARDGFGIDYNDITASAPRRRSRTMVDNQTFPSWTGVSMLYAGLLKQRKAAAADFQLELFSEAIETMQSEIELAYQFAGEPAHFIQRAKAEHKAAWTRFQSSDLGGAADPNQRFILRRPDLQADQDICLLSIYAPKGQISPATVDYVNLLSKNGFTVIACLALDDTACDLDVSYLTGCAGIVIRQNKGMDFSAWAAALELLPDCWSANRLVFANDSVFTLPHLMGPFLDKLRSQTADFVCLTECFLHFHHGQSYFFMLQSKALGSTAVRAFWDQLQALEKADVIRNYELRLLGLAKDDWQLSTQVLYSMDVLFPGLRIEEYQNLNVSQTHWEHLINQGFPFVKVELLRDNPLRLHIQHWRSVLEGQGVSLSHIDAHLKLRRSPPQSKFEMSGVMREALMAARTWNRKRKIARNKRRLAKQLELPRE